MKKKLIKVITLVLILAILAANGAMAVSLPANQSNGTTTMQLNITPAQLSVEVPLTLSFSIDKNGAVTAPSAVDITNLSYAPVKVVSVTPSETSPWSIVAMDTDFTTKKINTKEFAFSLKGQSAQNDSSFITTEFATMAAKDTATLDANKLSLPIGSVSRIAPQRDAATAQGVAQLVFIFDFVE